jgi:hypothetical protein
MIRRRTLLAAGLALPLVPGPNPARAAAPRSALETFLRLRCSPEGQSTFWFYSGHMLARREGEPMRPLLSVIGASRSRIARQSDGSVVYSLIEAGYYGPPDAPDIADGPIPNALTGAPMTPEHYLSPQTIRFTPDLKVLPEMAAVPPGLDYRGRITPPNIKGDRLWMAEELFIKIAGKSPKILNSLANFEASVKDIESAADFVPASMQYTTLNSLRPWMNMGADRGEIMMRLNGLKLQRWDEVPKALRQRIEADHGDKLYA